VTESEGGCHIVSVIPASAVSKNEKKARGE
jgi:hypothetical protein